MSRTGLFSGTAGSGSGITIKQFTRAVVCVGVILSGALLAHRRRLPVIHR
jgi:hypothetical protein